MTLKTALWLHDRLGIDPPAGFERWIRWAERLEDPKRFLWLLVYYSLAQAQSKKLEARGWHGPMTATRTARSLVRFYVIGAYRAGCGPVRIERVSALRPDDRKPENVAARVLEGCDFER